METQNAGKTIGAGRQLASLSFTTMMINGD
jgi:hypothetical protein